MIIRTRCGCGYINQSEISMGWATGGSIPITCEECGNIYLATTTVEESIVEEEPHQTQAEELTILEIATRVIIDNKDSEVHGQEGIIIDKDFMHYKIKFQDGKAIWLPHHWILKKSRPMKYTIAHYVTVAILALSLWGLIDIVKLVIELF
jgi:hypothetical protein